MIMVNTKERISNDTNITFEVCLQRHNKWCSWMALLWDNDMWYIKNEMNSFLSIYHKIYAYTLMGWLPAGSTSQNFLHASITLTRHSSDQASILPYLTSR
jgi:hypothetical protein